MNLLGSSNRAKLLWRKLVTRLIYSPYFGSIGRGSVIMRPLFLEGTPSIHIGSRVQIREGARLEVVEHRCGPGLRGRVEIGDDTSIEQGLHLTCGESIRIGRFVAITEYVGIFDILHGYEDPETPIVRQPLKTSPVVIEDHCLIGMGAVIQPGVTIGRHCVIGANAVVTRNIPEYSVAVGSPARVIRRYDRTRGAWVRVSEAP